MEIDNMKVLEKGKTKAVLEEQVGGEKYTYTLVDMGGYVGYSRRPWYENPKPFWMVTSIDMDNGERKLHYEALPDADGELMQVRLRDGNNNVRTQQYYGGRCTDDTIYMGSLLDEGGSYRWDSTQNEFTNIFGDVVPAMEISNHTLPSSLVQVAASVQNEFARSLEVEANK